MNRAAGQPRRRHSQHPLQEPRLQPLLQVLARCTPGGGDEGRSWSPNLAPPSPVALAPHRPSALAHQPKPRPLFFIPRFGSTGDHCLNGKIIAFARAWPVCRGRWAAGRPSFRCPCLVGDSMSFQATAHSGQPPPPPPPSSHHHSCGHAAIKFCQPTAVVLTPSARAQPPPTCGTMAGVRLLFAVHLIITWHAGTIVLPRLLLGHPPGGRQHRLCPQQHVSRLGRHPHGAPCMPYSRCAQLHCTFWGPQGWPEQLLAVSLTFSACPHSHHHPPSCCLSLSNLGCWQTPERCVPVLSCAESCTGFHLCRPSLSLSSKSSSTGPSQPLPVTIAVLASAAAPSPTATCFFDRIVFLILPVFLYKQQHLSAYTTVYVVHTPACSPARC